MKNGAPSRYTPEDTELVLGLVDGVISKEQIKVALKKKCVPYAFIANVLIQYVRDNK